jgi:hypothetical protein
MADKKSVQQKMASMLRTMPDTRQGQRENELRNETYYDSGDASEQEHTLKPHPQWPNVRRRKLRDAYQPSEAMEEYRKHGGAKRLMPDRAYGMSENRTAANDPGRIYRQYGEDND